MRGARIWGVAAIALLVGCGGDDDDNGGTGPNAVFTTMTVEPANPTVVVNFTLPLSVIARDQNNAAMSGLTATYTSSDLTKATVNGTTGVVTGVAAGTSTITITGTVGSVTKTATTVVTVGAPPTTAAVSATLQSTFVPNLSVVARTGAVTWTFAMLHNVTFDGTTAPTNIPDTATGSVSRTFPTAGTYTYRCTIHPGMTGTVTVVP